MPAHTSRLPLVAAITDTSAPMGTLTSWHTTYLAGRIARGEIGQRTAKGMRYSLRSFDRSFGARPLNQLGKRAVLRWLEQVGHLSPATRRNHISTVRGFCRWLVDEGLIGEDPTAGIERVRQPRSVPRAMRRDDIARLFAALPDLRARVIVTLMVEAGLRCVEVSRLDWEDWDPVAETITVRGKSGHERVLPVTSTLGRVLGDWAAMAGVVAGPLVRQDRRRNERLSAETISTYVSRWMSSAGLKRGRWDGVSAHALRHTAASDVLDACQDLRVVQAMLGHQHLATTSIYLRRASLGQMREAMEGRAYLTAA